MGKYKPYQCRIETVGRLGEGIKMIKNITIYNRLYVKDVDIGWRVVLTHPDPEYTVGNSNPVLDSRYECLGTINSIEDNLIEVKWDNGFYNSYKDLELSDVEENIKCRSIWGL